MAESTNATAPAAPAADSPSAQTTTQAPPPTAAPGAAPEASAGAAATDDAYLEQFFGEGEKPAADAAAQPAGEKPAEGAAAAKPADAPATPEARLELSLADRALRRSGMTDADLALLSPARRVELGKTLAAQQTTVDAALSALKKHTGKDKLEEAVAALTAPLAAPQTKPAASDPAATTQTPAAVAQLDGELNAALDEAALTASESAKIQALFAKQRQLLGGQAAAAPKVTDTPEYQQLQTSLASAQESLALARYDLGVNKLGTTYPELATDAGWAKLQPVLDRLDPQAQSLTDPAAFMSTFEEACRVVWGKQAAADARQAAIRTNAATRAGQPETPAGGRPVAASSDEDAMFDLITAGLPGSVARGRIGPPA